MSARCWVLVSDELMRTGPGGSTCGPIVDNEQECAG
jgi:hypothetical protein